MTTHNNIVKSETVKVELIGQIWKLLEENTVKLNSIPQKEQRFDWQDMANLRGCFRQGPNNSGRTIDSFDTERLERILYRMKDIEDSMRRYHQKTMMS